MFEFHLIIILRGPRQFPVTQLIYTYKRKDHSMCGQCVCVYWLGNESRQDKGLKICMMMVYGMSSKTPGSDLYFLDN